MTALSIEFWPWRTIPDARKREVTCDGDSWEMEVLGETFLGEPVWLPYMGGGS